MQKTCTKLEVSINNRSVQLYIEYDMPIPDIKEALFGFVKYVGQVEDVIKQTQAKQEEKKEEGNAVNTSV